MLMTVKLNSSFKISFYNLLIPSTSRSRSVCWRDSRRLVREKVKFQDKFHDHHPLSCHSQCLQNCADFLPRTLLTRFAIHCGSLEFHLRFCCLINISGSQKIVVLQFLLTSDFAGFSNYMSVTSIVVMVVEMLPYNLHYSFIILNSALTW